MNEADITKLSGVLIEAVEKSHSSVSKTISDFGAELKQLAKTVDDVRTTNLLQTEHLSEIVKQNKVRNGRIDKCEGKLGEIDTAIIQIEAVSAERKERKSDVWIVGGVIVTVLSGVIGWYAYTTDARFNKLDEGQINIANKLYDHINEKASVENLSVINH
jgi:hypothetical protein